MKTSQRGVDLIKRFEGLRLTAYPDPASGGEPFTIGYGTTRGVRPGMTITSARAEELLRADLERFEDAIGRLVTARLCQHQLDALVSFTYNVGEGALRGSTLLRMLNSGDYAGAALQFERWVNAAGKVMPGLVKRRAAERALFEDAQ